MKKIILLLLLVLVSVTASARKSYITMTTGDFIDGSTHTNSSIILSGEVPEDIENKGFSYVTNHHCWLARYSDGSMYATAEILNWLSEYGYEVEFVSQNLCYYILSKEIPSGSQTQIEGDVNHDSEVNIADVNRVISLILGIVREHPEILEQIKKQTNH